MMDNQRLNFWLGNGLLIAALAVMLFMGSLWDLMGTWAMGLWMTLAGTGMYLLMRDKGPGEPPG